MVKDIIDEIVALKRKLQKELIGKIDSSSTLHRLRRFREELTLTDTWTIDSTDLTVSEDLTANDVWARDIQNTGTFIAGVARAGYSDA